MAKRRKKNNGRVTMWVAFALLAAIYFAFSQCNSTDPLPVAKGEMELHIIDVGQGDAALIRTEDAVVLIDAGPRSAKYDLESYLDSLGIESIDYAVFTHPHEDHIGGADMIMTSYAVKNVIMPGVEHTSATFESMIDAIEESGASVYQAVYGDIYDVGSLRLTVLGPVSEEYNELNDYSVVMRVDFGETSFMLTGDAEALSEGEIMRKFSAKTLDCDFLKVGHHGSTTSNTWEFLTAVSPDIASISCETGNSYGHPHKEILDRLKELDVTVYRTDLSGDLVFVSDGKEISAK